MLTKRTKGFTLVEILIVVIILGILAAIIIPQFTDASQDARKSSVQSNLQALRSQFELYRAQHLDVYPWDVPTTDAVDFDTTIANISARLTSKTNNDGSTTGGTLQLGPYMQRVPENPFAQGVALFSEGTSADADASSPPSQWIIDSSTGAIIDGTGTITD